MQNQEPTNSDILSAIKGMGQRIDKIENTNNEILQAINNFATNNEQRLQGIESEIGTMKSDIGTMKSEIGSIKATMVTKDYLDDKLADLRGDLIILARKGNVKLNVLIDELQKQNIISREVAQRILCMEPFPQLSQ